jgi:hypothetical protein
MVSKLLLAAQECYHHAEAEEADPAITAALAETYYDIRQGLGFNNSPAEYGAFPTDPYSHTPMGGGARQPGMTGQVKEEILTRWGELGVSIQDGRLQFLPTLLRPDELLPFSSNYTYIDVAGETKAIPLPPKSLAFTLCQIPVIYTREDAAEISLDFADGRSEVRIGNRLDLVTTRHILARDGRIKLVRVSCALSEIDPESRPEKV